MKPKFKIGESVKITGSWYPNQTSSKIYTIKLILDLPPGHLYQIDHKHPWLLFKDYELESAEAEEFHNVLEKLSE